MNPRIRFLMVVAAIALVLAASNPGLMEFNAYVKAQIEKSQDTSVDRQMRDMMVGVSKTALQQALEKGAVRKDYAVFSIFEIENPAENKIHKILGFAKKVFIPLNESPKWDELKPDF